MICVKITLIQISTQNIIARHPLAFKGLRGKRPKKWDNSAEKCGEKKGMMFHVKHRRRGLRIIRFRASAKAHPLRRASSSTENRFAGFSVDFGETRGVPLLRLFPPQPLRWVASERGKYGILRFRASAKAHPHRRTSFSTENRFAGFSVDFGETRGVPLPLGCGGNVEKKTPECFT